LCKAHGIEPVFAVEGDGKYRADWLWLGGQGSVINPKFNAPDGPICTDLRAAGALLSASDFRHSYPHSWRSKARIIYRCTPQWFIPMDRSANSDHPGDGRRAETGAQGAGGARRIFHSARTKRKFGKRKGPTPQPSARPPSPPSRTRAGCRRVRANRIHAMVADRPDWVISRQRAWGRAHRALCPPPDRRLFARPQPSTPASAKPL
jgi:isoleucyl-tRNA synthetase